MCIRTTNIVGLDQSYTFFIFFWADMMLQPTSQSALIFIVIVTVLLIIMIVAVVIGLRYYAMHRSVPCELHLSYGHSHC